MKAKVTVVISFQPFGPDRTKKQIREAFQEVLDNIPSDETTDAFLNLLVKDIKVEEVVIK